MRTVWILLFLSLFLAAGCGETEAPAPQTDGPAPYASKADSGKPDRDLGALEEKMEEAKDSFESDRKDAAAKKAYVDATVEYGTAVMLAPELTPKEKYPKALRLFREVLKLDPDNAQAKKSAETIEAIYKSMGRPVPS
jgi:tetratricopeptide (TPR) repeat protein